MGLKTGRTDFLEIKCWYLFIIVIRFIGLINGTCTSDPGSLTWFSSPKWLT